jgi:5-formyltetrahydrofolate cyclo-ligase
VVSRAQKDCQIRQKMIELLKVDVTSVFCYVSMGSEVDTTLLIRELRENMNVYVPYTYNGEMQAVKLKEETLTYEVDKQGNLYDENERVQVLCDDPQVCIVPLLAYNDKL